MKQIMVPYQMNLEIAMKLSTTAQSLRFAREIQNALTRTGGTNGTAKVERKRKFTERDSATILLMLLLM